MRYTENRIKARHERNEVAVGSWLQTGSPAIIEIAGAAGFDFVMIDCEHGAFSFDHAVSLIRTAEAAQVTPLVRVPGASLRELGLYLDAGAKGVLVPQVNSAEQARAIVAAAKYRTSEYPTGSRGACPVTRATAWSSPDWPEYADRSNRDCLVWLLIESPEAVDDLDAILDVPGVDGVQFGSHDLSVTMGHDGNWNHPAVLEKLKGTGEKATSKGVEIVGSVDNSSPEAAAAHQARLVAQGCRIFLTGSDGRIIYNAFRRLDAALRPAA